MPTVGEQLRAARERLKLSVQQVAEATKIKTDHIRALEEGRWSVFSAPVYVRGSVRSCAAHLKLDVPALMRDLEAELGQTEGFREPPSLTGRRRGPLDFVMLQMSRVKWQLVFPLLLGVAVVLAAVHGVKSWRAQQKKDPFQGLGSGLHQPAKPAAADTLPLPTNAAPARRNGP